MCRGRQVWVTIGLVWLFESTAFPTSIARLWNEQEIAAIRIDVPNPPVHARNLFHVSAAMYDAWAAYDGVAVGYLYHDKHNASDVLAARQEAISYAAYRLLRERYALSRSASTTIALLDAQMTALGYDKNNVSVDTITPAGVGNLVAATVSAYFLDDGALQTRFYIDFPAAQGGYAPVNPLMDIIMGSPFATNPNCWQPLYITNATAQNGFPAATAQIFLGSQWLGVRPFALRRTNPRQPWFDPGPPPQLGTPSDTQYRQAIIEVIRKSSELTPDDGVFIDISPGAWGNNTLGNNNGTGHPLNPVTGQRYAPNVVKRGDYARVLAEFWADGPHSETPPGHWNVIANNVADDPAFSKRLGGAGPVLDDLEWDVKMYFVLNAALHDAACAAWSLKRYYDGWRPVEAIRYMGSRGQCSDPLASSYDTNGLPLVPGLIELVTTNTAAPSGRHEGLPVAGIALYAWPGQPADWTHDYSGVKWTLATNWWPYQRATFVTPSFPGYISGHSTFSRAAAEVLAAATGSPFFPGGLAVYTNAPLQLEKGPSQPVELQWATYFDAADQAGLSRLWGGIHVSVDDLTGRVIGAQCGRGACALARRYFDGSIAQEPVMLTLRCLPEGKTHLTVSTVRGLFYSVQATSDLSQPFTNVLSGAVQALDSEVAIIQDMELGRRFYRATSSMGP